MARTIEWRLEPHDGEDIIDPKFYDREPNPTRELAGIFDSHPDAAWVDLCRVERYGDADYGITDEVYDYRFRYYRDGRVVALATERGLSPVEAR